MIEIHKYLLGTLVWIALFVKTGTQFFYKQLEPIIPGAYYIGDALAWLIIAASFLLILYQKKYLYLNSFTNSVLILFLGLTVNNIVDEITYHATVLNWTEPVFVGATVIIIITLKIYRSCLMKNNRNFGKGL